MLKVDFKLPELFLPSVTIGQTVDVLVDALPGRTFTGEIYAIDPQVDVNGRALALRARLPNADNVLRPGLFARVLVKGKQTREVVLAPESAIVPRGGETFVFRIDDGKAIEAKVKLGERRGAEVEILEGVPPNTQLVTAGQLKLRNGVAVEVDRCGPGAGREESRRQEGRHMSLFEFCIRRPVFSTVLSLVLVLLGIVSYGRLTVREYPNVDEPVVSVSTSYPGASASIIESQITQVLEGSIAGIAGIDVLESTSRAETSRITVRFRSDVDPDVAASDVRDRVSRVRRRLPVEVQEPTIAKVEADAQAIMNLVFTSDRMNALEITDYVDRFVLDRLKNLNGVADVTIFGERRYAMRIWIDRERLAAFNLTVQDVENALKAQNVELPSGRIESRDREFSVLSRTGLVTPEQFRNIVIKIADGHQVKLGEVARVELGAADERRDSRYNGQPAITVGIIKQAVANPLDVSKAVRTVMPEINQSLPQGLTADDRQRQRGVHRPLDHSRLPHHRRGDPAGGAGDRVLPALAAGLADPDRHHPDLADRDLHAAVRDGLHRQHADPARHGARHRPGGGRRHRGAGEHPPAHRARHEGHSRGHRGHQGDRLCRHRHDADAGGGVRADRLRAGPHRAAVPGVRAGAGGRGGGVGLRGADADADDVLQAAAAQSQPRAHLQPHRARLHRLRARLQALPGDRAALAAAGDRGCGWWWPC